MYHLIFVVINIFTTTFFGEHVSGIICIITILNNMRSTHFPQSMAKLQAGMDDALPGPCPAEQLECVGLKTQKPSCRRTSKPSPHAGCLDFLRRSAGSRHVQPLDQPTKTKAADRSID